MYIKHGYRKESEGTIKCRFCPRKYKNRPDCEIHMKENHDYDAVALRKKEREEKKIQKLEEDAALNNEKAQLRAEIARIKAEETRLSKEVNQNEREELKIEKKRKRKDEV